MATIEISDKLIRKVIKIGHYQDAQNAVDSILFDYLQVHQKQATAFDKLCLDLEMNDDEIDSLFKRDKDSSRTLDL